MKKGKPGGFSVEEGGLEMLLGREFGADWWRDERPVGGVDLIVDLLAGGIWFEAGLLSFRGGSQKAVENVM